MRASRERLFSLAVAIVGLAAPSHAADVSAIPETNGGSAIIVVRGDLASGDHKAFANVALAHSSAVVILNSNGGLLLPGFETGKAIRLEGFATIVPGGSQCASACTLAWLADTPRFLSPPNHASLRRGSAGWLGR